MIDNSQLNAQYINPVDFAEMQQNPDYLETIGPFEFSVFERVETNLEASSDRRAGSQKFSKDSVTSSVKYEATKEVIQVTGWVNINSIYLKYRNEFMIKILAAILLICSLKITHQRFWPLTSGLTLVSFFITLKYCYRLIQHRKSHMKLKYIYWIELQISLGYSVVMTGFFLYSIGYIVPCQIFYFVLPFMLIVFLIFVFNADDNIFLAQKSFCLLESIQFMMIAAKLSNPQLMNWNVCFVIYMAAAIYMTTLGLLLSIILSCSMFGFLYRDLESWKIKSLGWMTWYYLFSGLAYIYVIKGIMEFYEDDNIILTQKINSYVGFRSNTQEILLSSAGMLILFNSIALLMHLSWKKDIKNYLRKIIFRKDIRKEVSLRVFRKNFSFKVIQHSAVFFKREDPSNSVVKFNVTPLDTKSQISTKEIMEECLICYDNMPNIMFEPCGHGGVCKKCAIEYVKDNDKCMIGRTKIERMIVIEYDKKDKCYIATGEIKLE